MYSVQDTSNGPKAIIDVYYVASVEWSRATEPTLDVQDALMDKLHANNPTLATMVERIKDLALDNPAIPTPQCIYVFATIDIPHHSEAKLSEDPDYSWYKE